MWFGQDNQLFQEVPIIIIILIVAIVIIVHKGMKVTPGRLEPVVGAVAGTCSSSGRSTSNRNIHIPKSSALGWWTVRQLILWVMGMRRRRRRIGCHGDEGCVEKMRNVRHLDDTVAICGFSATPHTTPYTPVQILRTQKYTRKHTDQNFFIKTQELKLNNSASQKRTLAPEKSKSSQKLK